MLTARSLCVRIRKTHILRHLEFDIPDGSFVGVLGPNGSGKTTLLRSIAGSVSYSGQLTYREQELSTWPRKERARHIAVVQQNPSIHFDFTVLDFVRLGLLPTHAWLQHSDKTAASHVDEILATYNLEALQDRLLPTLSGGELQRVLLAQALIKKPSLLLLDEPVNHLDVYYQYDVLSRIRMLANQGYTILVVFHDLSLAAQFSDLLLILNQGTQVAFGSPQRVLTKTLIRDTFRMNADLSLDASNRLRIQFNNMIP